MDLPPRPSGDLLLSYLKHRRPFNSGGTRPGAMPTMTGALGTAYPHFEFKLGHKPLVKGPLEHETDDLYQRTLDADPDTYTVRAFDTLLSWYDERRGYWMITTVRAGAVGNMGRQAVRGALRTLELPTRLLTLEERGPSQ